MTIDIDHLLAEHDPEKQLDAPTEGFDAEQTLALVRSMQVPAEVVSRRRPLVVATVLSVGAAATFVALVAVPMIDQDRSTPTTVGLVAFSERADGTVVAKITDPSAGADQLTGAFRAHGLDIRVSAVPASPSVVGTVVFSDFDAKPIRARGCSTGGGGDCQIGFVVPAGFSGHGEAAVGRPALPGEEYASSNSVFAPGESLHCSGLVGLPAGDPSVAAVLADDGLVAEWSLRSAAEPDDGSWSGIRSYENERLPAGSQAPDGYISSGIPLTDRRVLLNVGQKPPASSVDRARRGC